MSQPAIIVENLSKKFRIGTGGGPGYHRLSEMLTGLPRFAYNKLRPPRAESSTSLSPDACHLTPSPDFWALRDVSFEVQPGEVVGIIGRNGAGKSTLLKILSRITEPTSGRFGVRGRVASLLEVGTGFHPELTGRENIYVSGITLGMTRTEIKKRFDEIVDFSGVEKFLDTPVKHYSSGMQVRLGFAVAAHLESEILIIDEVLAVGDAEFQKKCLRQLHAVSMSGRTVLFVSHNLVAVRRICNSAIELHCGRVRTIANAETACASYESNLEFRDETEDEPIYSADKSVELIATSARNLGRQNSVLLTGFATEIEVVYRVHAESNLNVSIIVTDDSGIRIFNTFSPVVVQKIGTFRSCCVIPQDLMNARKYFIETLVVRNGNEILICKSPAATMLFSEGLRASDWTGEWTGLIRPILLWNTSNA